MSRAIVLLAPLLLLGAPARAATLPFTATLSLGIGALPAAVFSGSGVGQSMGGGGSFTVPSNFLAGTVTFFVTNAPPVYKLTIQVTGNGSGSFNPGFTPPLLHPAVYKLGGLATTPGVTLAGGGIGGAMPVGGGAGVNVFAVFTIPVPLGVLGTGSSVLTKTGGVSIQVVASQWTTGVAKMLLATETTYHLPASMSIMLNTTVTTTGSDARTPGGKGMVTLVSPVKAITNISGNLAVVARLKVNFIPEPGSLLLFAVGVVGLAAFGSRRRPQL